MIDRYDWDQTYKLMLKASEYEDFIRRFANTDATPTSFLYAEYQKEAQALLRKP